MGWIIVLWAKYSTSRRVVQEAKRGQNFGNIKSIIRDEIQVAADELEVRLFQNAETLLYV